MRLFAFEIKQSIGLLPEKLCNFFQVPSNASEICYIIKASPGTRQVESKGIIVKKKYSLPKDIPQGTIV